MIIKMKHHSIFKGVLCLLLAASLTGCASAPLPTEDSAVQTSVPTAAPTSEPTEIPAAPTSEPTEIPAAPTSEPTEIPTPPQETVVVDFIDRLVSEMSLRQKVGQLFIVRPDSLEPALEQEQINDSKADGVTVLTDAMTDTLEDYPVGGIVMFSKNITSPDQITAFNEALQHASEIPLFLSIDEEGGLVSRLANHKAFDLAQYESAAAIEDEAQALDMGSTIGAYLKEYGFNMDFAPVADVNTNPDNPIIGTRAFSSDAETAARMAASMADGLRQQGVIPVFKHFPGHGDTAEDSHYGLAASYKTAAEMEACEWLPFAAADPLDCVMVGHIAVPEITGDMTPATMSGQVVDEILKEQLGFQGLVVTDSLAMEAITDEYDPGEAALGALRAGCDLLLMPNGLREAFDAVVAAVEDGTFPEAQLDEIVERILRFKMDHGLLGVG